ncbi:MAG: hypothetical protein NDJ89_04340 [Oligoflexia bacterium]|nr:hypothetical protein [Oligoflexia bacterium]
MEKLNYPRSLASLLFIALTLTAACGAVTNDYSRKRLRGDKGVYQPGMRVGFSAGELLRTSHFDRVVVEIQSVRGFAPSQEAVNLTQRFLERHLKRSPGQIQIHASDSIPVASLGGKTRFTLSDVRFIESRYRRRYTQKGTLTIYLLFLNGSSADDHGEFKMLGQAHSNTSIVIYENTILEKVAENPNASRPVAEATIIAHELGHVLGLVNIDRRSGTGHEDPLHANHCDDPRCLMHFTAENTLFVSPTGAVPELTESCLRELEELRSLEQ